MPVGNDVVDLSDPDAASESLHPRFDSRVFAPSELHRIQSSDEPNQMRWMFWAAKEAAYKAARRAEPGVVFSPSRFVVDPTNDGPACASPAHRPRQLTLTGSVRHEGDVFALRVSSEGGAIHAIATSGSDSPSNVLSDVRRLPEHESSEPADLSRAVRGLAIDELAEALRVDAGELEVHQRGRIPEIRTRNGERLVDLSLSHHGRVVAFAAARPEVRG